MKQIIFSAAVCFACIASLSSCNTTFNKGDVMPDVTSAKIDSVSYALGMIFAKQVEGGDFGELHYGEFTKAFNDVLNGKETKLTEEEIMPLVQQYAMARYNYTNEKRAEENKAFFEENKGKEGVVETESGLQYKIEVEGEGIAPTEKDTVLVHYTGTLKDGTKFDSSYDRGEEPVELVLNRVIKGWSEGISYLKEGGKATLYVPSELAYGERGNRNIPGNSLLIFEVELVKVKPFVETPESKK